MSTTTPIARESAATCESLTVKLGTDQLGEPGLIIIVDAATALNDVNISLIEPSRDPAKCALLWVVVCVEDGDNLAFRVESKEVVDVVGFRGTLLHLDDAQIRVLRLHLAHLRLDWFDGLGRVIHDVDVQLGGGIIQLAQNIAQLTKDDILFVWQICYQHDVDGRAIVVGQVWETFLGGLSPSAAGQDIRLDGLNRFRDDREGNKGLQGDVDVPPARRKPS